MHWRNSVVYKIINIANRKIYIGSATNFKGRINAHLSQLRRNVHDNKHLQNAWNKYGEDCFAFVVIEDVNKDNILEREQYWLDNLRPYDKHIGYNISKDATAPMTGRKHTKEALAKISEASIRTQTGKQKSLESRKKMSLAKLGKKQVGKNIAGSKNSRAKTYIIETPSGEFLTIKGISEFCRENNLNQGTICKIARENSNSKHKGYGIKEVKDVVA